MLDASPSVAAKGQPKTRVFLSYSRQDRTEAERLRAELIAREIEVFQDIEDTLPGEEWWRRLTELIRQADTVVFLLSPRSSRSTVCADEVAHAASLNKRIFPVVIESVDWSAVPVGLAKVHSVFLDDPSSREEAIGRLIGALLVDIEWVRSHTRYLERAQAWDNQRRGRADLLSGAALERAERWLIDQPPAAPPPTTLQREFIQAGRAAATRRQRGWVLGSLVTAVAAGGLALFAYFQKELALGALTSQSVLMAQASEAQARAGDTGSAIQIALQALPRDIVNPDRPVVPAAMAALSFAMDQDRRVHTLTTTGGSVVYAAYSPDGSLIATIPYDGDLQIWNAVTGALVHNLGKHTDAMHLAFSPDGLTLAAPSKEGKAWEGRIWDVAKGTRNATLAGHTRSIVKIRFTPDGKSVVTTGMDNSARVWNATTGAPVTTIAGPPWSADAVSDSRWGASDPIMRAVSSATFSIFGSMAELAVSPDGQTAFTAGKIDPAGSPRMWALANGTQIRLFPGTRTQMFQFVDLSVSADGSRLAGASGDGAARIWNVATGDLIVTLRGHNGMVNSARFSPDGSRLVTASNDNTARLWDALTGRLIGLLRGHAAAVNRAVFSPDGALILTVSDDKTARLWDGQTGNAITVLHGHVDSVLHGAFSPDGKQLLTSSRDGTVRVWRSVIGQAVSQVRLGERSSSSPDTGKTRTVAVSKDGSHALVARPGRDDASWLINVETGQIIAEMDAGSGRFVSGDKVLLTNNLQLIAVDTGRVIAALQGSNNQLDDAEQQVLLIGEQSITVYDLLTGKPVGVSKTAGKDIKGAQFVRGGEAIVAVSEAGIEAWTPAGKSIGSMPLPPGKLDKFKIARTSGHVALQSSGGTVTLAATNPPRAIKLAQRQGEEFEGLQFSDDGRWLAALGRNGEVSVWRTADGATVLHNNPADSQAKDDGLPMMFGASHGFAEMRAAGEPVEESSIDRDNMHFITFTPEGFLLLGRNGVLWRFDGKTLAKQPLPLPRPHGDNSFAIVSTCSNRSGDRLLISEGPSHLLIDAETMREVKRFGPPDTDIYCQFKASDYLIAKSTDEKNARIYDMKDGKLRATIASAEQLSSVWLVGEGNETFATVSKGNKLAVWSVPDGKQIATQPDVDSILRDAGKVVWTLMLDGTAVAWQLPGLKRLGAVALPGDEKVAAFEHLANDQMLVTSSKQRLYLVRPSDPYLANPITGPISVEDANTVRYRVLADATRVLRSGPKPEDLQLLDSEGHVIKILADLGSGAPKTAAPATPVVASAAVAIESRYKHDGDSAAQASTSSDSSLGFGNYNSLEVTASGSALMQWNSQCAFRVWDARTGDVVMERAANPQAASSCRVTFVGNAAVSVLAVDGAFELWTIAKRGPVSQANNVSVLDEVSGDQAKDRPPSVLVGGKDGFVRLIETESGHDMWSNQLGPSAIKALRGDTFTGHAVAITETGKTGVWTLAAGKRLGVVEHDGHPVVWNEIEPKASRLWTMTDDRRLWTWSLAGAPLGGFELNGAPSPDAKSGEPKIEIEKAYAGTGRSSLLFAYDIEDNKRQWWLWNEKTRALHQLPGPWLGNGGLPSLPSLSSSSSPAEAGWTFLQGNRLIERDPAGAVRVRTADTGEQLATLLPGKDKRDGRSADGTGTGETKETPLPTVVSSADGSRIITNSVGRLQLWDAATGKPVPFEGGANVSRFEFQGKTLVIERTGGAIELRRAREGTTLSAMPGSDAEGAAGRASDTAGIDHFLAGNRLALGNNGEIWDLREGKRLLDHVLAADAAGEKVLWASYSGDFDRRAQRLEVLEAATGKPIHGIDLAAPEGPAVPSFSLSDRLTQRVSLVHGLAAIVLGGGEVQVWDLDQGTLVRTLAPRKIAVADFSFHPTERLLAIAFANGQVEIWNFDSGTVTSLPEVKKPMVSLSFNDDGSRLAGLQSSGEAALWNVSTAGAIPIAREAAKLRLVHFAGEGQRIVTESAGEMMLLNATDGTLVKSFKLTARSWASENSRTMTLGKGDRYVYQSGELETWLVDTMPGERSIQVRELISSVKPVLDSATNLLAYATSSKGVTLVKPDQPGSPVKIEGLGSDVSVLALAPGGAVCAIATSDGRVTLWNAKSAAKIADIGGRWRETGLAFNADGTYLAVSGASNTVLLIKSATGAQAALLEGHGTGVRAVEFSLTGKELFALTQDGERLVWDVPGGALRMKIEIASTSSSLVERPSGLRLLVPEYGKTPQLYRIEPGGAATRISAEAKDDTSSRISSFASAEEITAAAFLPDRKTVVLGRGRGGIEFFDMSEGRLLASSSEHETTIKEIVVVGPDRIVTRPETGAAILWDARQYKPIARLSSEKSTAASIAMSPDGSKLVTLSSGSGSSNNEEEVPDARLWRSTDGVSMGQLAARNKERPNLVLFGADGKTVVTGNDNGRVEVYDAVTGAFVRQVAQHRFKVVVMAIQPSTGYVFSASEDQDAAGQRGGQTGTTQYASVQLRNPATGASVLELPADSALTHAKFSADGSLLLTGTVTGVIRIIDAATGYTLIERRAGPSKTVSLALSSDASAFAATFESGSTQYWHSAPESFERRPTAVELVEAARKK